MVALTPRFASLLAFAASSSVLMSGVEALPFRDREGMAGSSSKNLPMPALFPHHQAPSSSFVEARRHHHDGDHHHGEWYSGHGTKVYADDPVVISGDNNHVHSHSHKRSHNHHGNHHGTKVYADDPLIVSGDNNHVHSHSHKRHHDQHNHHGHHRETKVYADDPLVVSGDGNHVHSHSHKRHSKHHHHQHHTKPLELTTFKRGLIDPVVPLLGSIPGVGGVISLMNMVTHAVFSDTLASLIISSAPTAMSAQSLDGEQMPSFSISASNSSSTTMYLVAQNTTADLGPSEKVVLITMPMFHAKDQTVKTYCASYDPNSPTPSQLTSQPCSYNINAGLDINSTSTHFSQLFSWNMDSGEITPLWHTNARQPAVQAESTEQPDGFVVGAAPAYTTSNNQKPLSGSVAMVFKIDPAVADSSSDSAVATSTSNSSDECDEDTSDMEDCSGDTGDDSQASQSPDDVPTNDTPTDDEAPEDAQAYANQPSDINAVKVQSAGDASSTSIATATQQDATPTDTSSAQESAEALVITSTFTMLVAPTQSADASAADASTSAPNPTATL